VHIVSRSPNLRHLGEPLGGAEGLLEAVSFKKATRKLWVEEEWHQTEVCFRLCGLQH